MNDYSGLAVRNNASTKQSSYYVQTHFYKQIQIERIALESISSSENPLRKTRVSCVRRDRNSRSEKESEKSKTSPSFELSMLYQLRQLKKAPNACCSQTEEGTKSR